jgi:hypothetical protein
LVEQKGIRFQLTKVYATLRADIENPTIEMADPP